MMVNQSINKENGRWTKSVQRNCAKYKWSFNLWFQISVSDNMII